MEMKPEQVRERMELFGLAVGEKESDLFLKSVCDAYEELYYQLVEKEDKVSTLSDAVKYYKNMESNMAQMLSTISEISEKTEHAAEKTAQLMVKEAESRSDEILAKASEQAAQILEDAKVKAQEITEHAEEQISGSKEELKAIQAEFEAYALRFYDFMEKQKAFFEEHRIDVEKLRKTVPKEEQPSAAEVLSVQAAPQPVAPIVIQTIPAAVPAAPAAIACPPLSEDVSVNQIRKIPNVSVHKEPSMEEIQERIPEEIRNIPISDHTETLDEIIQSIKKSYEEVEGMETAR